MKAPVLKTVRPARVSGVRIPPPPPASLAFSLSRWRSARKLDFAAQNARISHGQTSNVWVKRTAGLAICLYFSEARSGSGVSQAKLHHRFALTAHRQPVSPFLSLGVVLLKASGDSRFVVLSCPPSRSGLRLRQAWWKARIWRWMGPWWRARAGEPRVRCRECFYYRPRFDLGDEG